MSLRHCSGRLHGFMKSADTSVGPDSVLSAGDIGNSSPALAFDTQTQSTKSGLTVKYVQATDN